MKSTIVFFFCLHLLIAQESTLHISENTFHIASLSEKAFTAFMEGQLEETQFVLVGEQHGIKEVGLVAKALFNISKPLGYNTLCIETDAVLAQKIKELAVLDEPIASAKNLDKTFPFAIPFYNTKDDYPLFKNVLQNGGDIWGIDQTFMAQFRLNFEHLIQLTDNTELKKNLQPLRDRAIAAYEKSIASKNFDHMFWRSYDEQLHKQLLAVSNDPQEEEVLQQLWKTKEIYGYNSSKKYYKNNEVRGQLMKENFTRYYKAALERNELPHVIFKLGATHATRGLSMTNIYDISNYVSELAVFNNKKSLHLMVAGLTGNAMVGNPFAANPIAPFDNTKQLPEELQELLPSFTKKYTLIHLAPLREFAYGKTYSEALKTFIFNFDILVLIKDAEALTPLN